MNGVEEKALIELLRGTAIENDEAELARLRGLTPQQQMDVGFVLRAAMFEDEASKSSEISELAGVRSVDDALRFLRDPVGSYALR